MCSLHELEKLVKEKVLPGDFDWLLSVVVNEAAGAEFDNQGCKGQNARCSKAVQVDGQQRLHPTQTSLSLPKSVLRNLFVQDRCMSYKFLLISRIQPRPFI